MTVPLIGPDGRRYEIDPSELNAAIEQGFRVETPDAPRTGLEEAKEFGSEALQATGAAVEGVAEGVTGGLYGAVVGAGGGREQEELLRRREEYPTASMLGELGGMLVSPLNRAGTMVTKSLGATTRLGRVGANIAGGATSGLLFGASKTVSDAALGDTELTAEKLIAGGGLGMLLGGAGGGVGGVIEEGARVLLPAARTLASRAASALDDIANDAAISSTRAQQGVINRIGDQRLAEVARVLRDRGHIKGSPDEMLKSINAERSLLGQKLGQALDAADAAGKTPSYSELLKRLDDFEQALNPLERQSIAGDVKAARDAVLELGKRPAGSTGKQGAAFRALDDLKQTIQAKAKFSRGPVPLDDVQFGLRRQLAGIFRDELDRQLLPQLGSDAAKQFTEAKALYGALKDAERLAESGAGRVGERGALSYVGLKDLLAGNILGGAGTPFGIAGAVGAKVLREQGPAIVARIADRLAKEPALKAMAASFAATLPNVAPKLGPYAAVLAQELHVSPERALASHIAHSQLDPSYAATAQLAGLTPEEPDEAPAALARAQTVAEAQAAASAFDQRLKQKMEQIGRAKGEPAASSVFKSQDFGAKRMRREDGYEQRVKEVRMLATDPQALLDRVAANVSGLGSVAPSLTMAMNSAAARAVEYLTQQAEVPPKAGPMAPEWDVPQADRYTFSLKLEAVQDPMSVLERAADGSLVEEQVEAVRTVYPKLYQSIQMAALERMTDGRPVPYKAKVMLSILTGIDPDGTLSPLAIAANQTAIMASGKKSDAPGAPLGGPGEPGEGDVTLASRSATPSQRREMRDEV